MQQRELFQYRLAYALYILQNFIIPEAQNSESFSIEELGSLPVVLGHLGMLAAVDLDDESM